MYNDFNKLINKDELTVDDFEMLTENENVKSVDLLESYSSGKELWRVSLENKTVKVIVDPLIM